MINASLFYIIENFENILDSSNIARNTYIYYFFFVSFILLFSNIFI